MSSTMNGFPGPLSAPERNHFFYGKLMDVTQFEKDARYFNGKRALINRMVLGHGVVCGLNVQEDPNAAGMLLLKPGMAIDGWGREVIVSQPVSFHPHALTDDAGKPTGDTADPGTVVVVCLAYSETKVDPVPVLVADCDTPGNCAPSTVREGFSVVVRLADDAPPAPPSCALEFPDNEFPLPPNPDLHATLAARLVDACPDKKTPTDPCVPLARVDLIQGGIGSIDAAAGRALIYSNALLYELILCLAARVQGLLP